MKYVNSAKSAAFIAELTIAVLVFAFSSAIALGLFANANELDDLSTDTNIAMMKVQSLAETAKNMEDADDFRQFSDPSNWPKYYDGKWNETSDAAEAVYVIDADFTSEQTASGNMMNASISARGSDQDPKTLFELSIKKYYPAE